MHPPITRRAYLRSAGLVSVAAAAMNIANSESANQYLTQVYRPGFGG